MYRGKRFPFTSFNSKRSSEAKRMSLYYTAGRERSRASSVRRCDSRRSQREVGSEGVQGVRRCRCASVTGAAGSSLVGFGPAVLPSACKTTTSSSSAVMMSTEKPHRFTQQTSVCVIRLTLTGGAPVLSGRRSLLSVRRSDDHHYSTLTDHSRSHTLKLIGAHLSK